MYTPFIIYMAICVIAIALATSHKVRCLFVAVVLAAVVFAGVLSLHGAARAEDQAPGQIISVRGEVIVADTVGHYIVFFGTGYKRGDTVMLLFGEEFETIDAINLTPMFHPLPLQ